MNTPLILQSNNGIMARNDDDDQECESMSFLSESASESMDGESSDDAMSAASAPPLMSEGRNQGPLYEMSSLKAQLPFKRGLSKCFEGKSQSFTSLAEARNLKDLKKPKRKISKKKIRPIKCYIGGLDRHKSTISTSNWCSKAIAKKNTSRGSLHSLLSSRRHGFMGI